MHQTSVKKTTNIMGNNHRHLLNEEHGADDLPFYNKHPYQQL